MPMRPEMEQFPVELDADAPAHADDHRLSFEDLQTLLEVVDDVLGDELESLLGPNDRFELRPLGLQVFDSIGFLALGRFFEIGIDGRSFVLVERQLREPALVVDRDGGLVLDRALDVVDADVVAEDGACVGVFLLDRRTSEADE